LIKNEYPPLLIEHRRREALLKSIDAINDKFGDQSIIPAKVIAARILE
jgi:hypothetical protein